MKTLIYSDSLCEGIDCSVEDDLHVAEYQYHCESQAGLTVEAVMDCEYPKYGLIPTQGITALSYCLSENQYDTVVLCLGVNDLGQGRQPNEVVADLLKLHRICFDKGVKNIIAMLLPSKYIDFNSEYTEVDVDPVNVSFCEFFMDSVDESLLVDDLHLNQTGLKKLARDIKLHVTDANSSIWD
jgi:lysophospholipase L1-like esterase